MFYKLIQRTLPGWFSYNSIYATQPTYTPTRKMEIAREQGSLPMYSLNPPSSPVPVSTVSGQAVAAAIQECHTGIESQSLKAFEEMAPMLSLSKSFRQIDAAALDHQQQLLVQSLLYAGKDLATLITSAVVIEGGRLLERETFTYQPTALSLQVDVLREYVWPTATEVL
jgi:hypothetical protein